MNITFFMRNDTWIYFYNTIFLKKATFSVKTEKNFFLGGHEHFLKEGETLLQK